MRQPRADGAGNSASAIYSGRFSSCAISPMMPRVASLLFDQQYLQPAALRARWITSIGRLVWGLPFWKVGGADRRKMLETCEDVHQDRSNRLDLANTSVPEGYSYCASSSCAPYP
jgi:hypothetical protein